MPTMNRIWNFLRSEDGPTSIEYGVMMALIVVVCLASISALGLSTRGFWELTNSMLSASSGS